MEGNQGETNLSQERGDHSTSLDGVLPRAVETACQSSAFPVLIVCSVGSDDVKFAVLADCKSVPKFITTDDIGAPNKLRRARRAPCLLQAPFELNSKSTQRSSAQLKAQSARLSEKLAQVTGNLFIDPTTVISKGVWNGWDRKVVGDVMSEASLRLGCVDAVDGLGVVLGSDSDDFVSVPMMHSDWTNAISSFEVRMSLHNDLRMNGSVHTQSLPPHSTGRDQPHSSVLIQQRFPDYVNVGDDRKQLFLSFVESLRMAGFSSLVQTVLDTKAGLAQDDWEEHASCCFNEAWHDLKKWPDQPDKFASVWNGEKEMTHNPSTGLV
ncbi:hypothetical protein BLNAU_8042 [Blattamonas nauphoetae]|uniref:Uncharacterized protein n=1 Tax=Blattamonas nauphoetae TaxID=2049346 RepID=A0ABQ9XZR2_9EUKA|nr:hypothetical protein BLNAU_8042 [Blattamonas nauphoetae]